MRNIFLTLLIINSIINDTNANDTSSKLEINAKAMVKRMYPETVRELFHLYLVNPQLEQKYISSRESFEIILSETIPYIDRDQMVRNINKARIVRIAELAQPEMRTNIFIKLGEILAQSVGQKNSIKEEKTELFQLLLKDVENRVHASNELFCAKKLTK